MATDSLRRKLLLAGAGTAIGGAVFARFGTGDAPGHLLLSACDDEQGRHCIAAWKLDRDLAFCLPVAHRAHAMTVVPGQRKAIFFARRPGTLSWLVDLDRGYVEATIGSVRGRHFYGHGVFSRDGRHLYTTENDYDGVRGVIGVYDAGSGYRRVAELDTGGIGPHELALLADGTTLVIANGGIQTHPDSDRDMLNIETMQPSLAYVDSRNGKLLGQYFPEDHLMSIRHLSVTPDDLVVMGVQYEGDPERTVPLVLTHRGDTELRACRASVTGWRSHANYIASVATSADGATALVAAPRGDTVSLWNLRSGTMSKRLMARDVAGAGFLAERSEFYMTSGLGQVYTLAGPASAAPRREFANRALHWDNHLAFA